MQSYFLTVVDIRKETDEASTISFKQPNLRKIKYKAGQYVSLTFRINDRKYSRAYSFSSSPSVNKNLEITVKKVTNGVVSNYILNQLKIGDIVEVMGPQGNFSISEDGKVNKIFLWGVGSGITPLYSILNEFLFFSNNVSVCLIYGNRDKKSSIFINELIKTSEEKSDQFRLINFFSKEDFNNNPKDYFSGRISATFVEELVLKDSNFRDSYHFICGPSELKNEIVNSLVNCGVIRESIFFEDFKIDLEESEVALLKNCLAKVSIKGEYYEFTVPKGKSVLDVALDNNLEIPYSCQTGDCGACKANLMLGELYCKNSNKLNGEEFSSQRLLCCSYPMTDEIVVEIE
jgi:ring-1,2-phenylacetyl-CoA epoxidase subunit PaaE